MRTRHLEGQKQRCSGSRPRSMECWPATPLDPRGNAPHGARGWAVCWSVAGRAGTHGCMGHAWVSTTLSCPRGRGAES